MDDDVENVDPQPPESASRKGSASLCGEPAAPASAREVPTDLDILRALPARVGKWLEQPGPNQLACGPLDDREGTERLAECAVLLTQCRYVLALLRDTGT